MQTQELAQRLGLATSTIRLWAREEFKQYLSESGQGGGGRSRYFSDTDARIIAYVATLKNQLVPAAEIHTTLKQLQANGWQDLPLMPAARPGMPPVEFVAKETADTALTLQRQAMLQRLEAAEARAQALEDELKAERQDKARVQAELTEAHQEIADLRGKLGTAEGQLTERQPVIYWLRIVVVVALIAVVVTAALALLLNR